MMAYRVGVAQQQIAAHPNRKTMPSPASICGGVRSECETTTGSAARGSADVAAAVGGGLGDGGGGGRGDGGGGGGGGGGGDGLADGGGDGIGDGGGDGLVDGGGDGLVDGGGGDGSTAAVIRSSPPI